MIRKPILLMAMVILFNSVANSETVTLEDTPHAGDTTVIETITTGNPVVTNNLLSQQWNDGTWTGDMFPDSSDINENIYLTGKDGKYAESTLNSQDILTEQELQQGLTSTLTAKVRWWNQWESTIEMRQTATNGIDTTTQSIILQDTTNHNNQFNSHTNTLVIAPDAENSHGTLTTRFTFDIDNAAGNWNNGHSGPDIIQPDLRLSYSALSSTTVTTVTHCYEKTPPTCPGQDELAEVENIIDTFEDDLQDLYFEDLYYEEQTFIPETIDFEYSFNPEIFEEEDFKMEDDYLAFDDFFFEEQFFEDDYYEEFELEEYFPETLAFEEVEFFDDMPEIEMFDELPPIEETFFEEEMYMEAFTEDAFIEAFEEYFEEEPPMEIVEEVFEEEIIEEPMEKPAEVAVAEEPMEEEIEEIKEQPNSESVVADEPTETTSVAKQEESNEESVKVADVKGDTTEEPGVVKENISEPELKSELDIKIAAIEKAIKSQIQDSVQQTTATLNVINEVVSREMVAMQPDMSSYANMNQALFDDRQLPQGNLDFFMQVSLATYDKTIYGTQANLVGTDPVVQYQIKLNEARSATNDAYIKLKGLMDARLN